MKAIVYESFGGVEKLNLKEMPIPKPEENEVLVEIHAAGVNPVDWKLREGLLKTRMQTNFPAIPGWDVAGVIKAVGKNVQDFQGGDAVYALCIKPIVQWGTYAEYVTVKASDVALKPEKLSFAQAAAIPLVGLTAWQVLFDMAHLKQGETVLIQAGAGGVGSLAIQMAKNVGAKVIATARETNNTYLKKLGADWVIDYTKESFVEKIKAEKPEGIDVVFDTMGGDILKSSLEVVKPGGRVVSIVAKVDESIAKEKNIQAGYVFVRPSGAQLKEITKLIDEGKIAVPTIEEYPLEKAPFAQEKIRTGHTQGKIVLIVKA